jgi:hypothetical protein
VEIHIAGGVVSRRGDRRIYVDDHTQPVREELFELLAKVLPRCGSLRALTFEGDGHPDAIAAATLERLRPLVPPRGAARTDVVPGEAFAAPGVEKLIAGDGWLQILEESHGIAPPSEDEVGTLADLDFRLAVLAQHLDRAYPISRLLLAATREELLSFCRSQAFRECFAEPSRTVEKAFSAWANQRVRASREPALEAVLALESFKALTGRPFPGKLPVDLTQVEFAARALRRHLAGRAWMTGTVEEGGLDGLWQVLRRSMSR